MVYVVNDSLEYMHTYSESRVGLEYLPDYVDRIGWPWKYMKQCSYAESKKLNKIIILVEMK